MNFHIFVLHSCKNDGIIAIQVNIPHAQACTKERIMLHSTTAYNATRVFGIEEGVAKLIDAGFPALDFGFFGDYSYIDDENYKERFSALRKYANDRGVIFNQAHAPFGGGFEKYTKEKVPKLPRVFEICGILGVEGVVVHPVQNGRYYGRAEELFEVNMSFYRSLAPFAKDCGVKILIENMWQRHPKAGYIIDDVCAPPAELVRYYDTLNDPEAFGICLDLGHVALCGREPEDAIRTIGHDRLTALHVHDVDYKDDLHTLPGFGSLNWDKICRALAEIDYKGVFTLESDGAFGKETDRDFLPTAFRFMSDTARFCAEKIERYKREIKGEN